MFLTTNSFIFQCHPNVAPQNKTKNLKSQTDKIQEIQQKTSTNDTQFTNTWQEQDQDFHAIVTDFERRLKEQVQLAREDVIRELEEQFKVSRCLELIFILY